MRVFRMLMIKGQLEQKQVADFSMLSPKDTRELLYKMLKAGYLALQVCEGCGSWESVSGAAGMGAVRWVQLKGRGYVGQRMHWWALCTIEEGLLLLQQALSECAGTLHHGLTSW